MKLLVDSLNVRTHRGVADVEPGRDFFVGASLGQQIQDLGLARGQVRQVRAGPAGALNDSTTLRDVARHRSPTTLYLEDRLDDPGRRPRFSK